MPQTCPYCRETIDPSNLTECTACHTPHHVDCWAENGGCTVFGCQNAPTDDPKIAVSAQDMNGSAARPNVSGPAARTMYYVAREGVQYGPYTIEVVREETYKGSIRREDLAWREGLENWVPLAQVLDETVPPPPLPRSRPAVAVYPLNPLSPVGVSAGPGDPCAGVMRFGRAYYFLSIIALVILLGAFSSSKETEGIGILIFWCAWIVVAVFRARDVGLSGWMVLLGLLPIANLWLGFQLLLAPRGYAITKQGDIVLRVMTWVLLSMGALALIAVIIAASSH